MKMQFEKALSVRRLHVVATLAVYRERRVELILLRWAQERLLESPRAWLSAEALAADELGPLPGRPRLLCAQLLRNCDMLGLMVLRDPLDDNPRIEKLTELGEESLARGRILVPEEGTWEILWSDDPLLPGPLLHVRKVEQPSAHDEMQEQRGRGGKERKKRGAKVSVPEALRALKGQMLKLHLPQDGLSELRVDKIGETAEEYEADARLALRLMLERGSPPVLELVLAGGGRGERRRLPMRPGRWGAEEVFAELWGRTTPSIAERKGEGWDPEAGLLRRPFAEVSDAARRAFREDVRLQVPYGWRGGGFPSVTARDVPVGPASAADAAEWYRWLLVQTCDGHETPADYQRRAMELAERFPGFTLEAPPQEELAHALRRPGKTQPEAFWFLQAPLDLDLAWLRARAQELSRAQEVRS
jgi:hypothetical protein